MSENTELMVPGGMLVPSKYGDDKTHDAIAASSAFLPRVQLVAAGANLVKKKKAEGGTYVVLRGKDNIDHKLGEQFSCLVLGWRPRALRFEGGKAISFFNPNTDGFKSVENDSKKKDSGCMFGPEYLVFLPEQDVICTFHFNNPTMRQSASPMKQNMGRAVTCRVELIEKPDYSWYGPVITGCSTPLPVPPIGTPERDALNERLKSEIDKFNNPNEREEELEEAPAAAGAPTEARG